MGVREDGIVDLWWADLRSADARLFALLDHDERTRLDRLATGADRGRLALGAALLRVAVAAATGVTARSVTVERTCAECGRPHGMPRVDGAHVSVSHAGPLVLVATADIAVGVDVESADRGDDVRRWVLDEARYKTGTGPEDPLTAAMVPTPLPGYLAAVAVAGGHEPRVTAHDVRESAVALERLGVSARA